MGEVAPHGAISSVKWFLKARNTVLSFCCEQRNFKVISTWQVSKFGVAKQSQMG